MKPITKLMYLESITYSLITAGAWTVVYTNNIWLKAIAVLFVHYVTIINTELKHQIKGADNE